MKTKIKTSCVCGGEPVLAGKDKKRYIYVCPECAAETESDLRLPGEYEVDFDRVFHGSCE